MPPIERTCKITGEKFLVSELEQNLRNKFGVELPDLSPRERLRHIMTFHNPRDMYAVNCDLCKKPILSMWGERPTFPVYCNPCYNSDKYEPAQMDLDLDRPFFDQFKELEDKTPHPARSIVEPLENSDFCNACTGLKNCYFSFEIGLSEDCYYCHRLQNTKGCVDCSLILTGENMYGCLACDGSYQVRWSEFARDCTDSMFLYDCVDCNNCAFSTGLRHKSYVFKNEQLTKEAYEKKIAELNTGSYSKLQEYLKEFEALKASYPKNIKLVPTMKM